MKVLFKLIAALVLTTSTLVAHAEIDKVIMSNSDAASVMSDRYAKKNGMSSEAARRELTEAGVFKDADGGSRTAAASAPAKAREATVYATVATPTPAVVVAAQPTVVAKAATAPAAAAVAPVVVANSKTPEVKTAPTPAVVTTAKAVPDATTVLVAAAPVVWPPFVMQIEKMVMADGGFATWQWLTLLSLLAALVLMRWFKKSPQSIIVNAPTNSASVKKAISEPVHIGNLSFYVPVVLDTPPAKPAKLHIDSNVALGFDFKTPLSKLHQILTKAEEVEIVEPEVQTQVLNVFNVNASDLPKHVITPNAASSESDAQVVVVRSRAQEQDNRLFGTNFKTPKSKLRDLISAPSSTLTQADV